MDPGSVVADVDKPVANFLDPGLFEGSSVIFRQHSQLDLTWPRTKVCQNGY